MKKSLFFIVLGLIFIFAGCSSDLENPYEVNPDEGYKLSLSSQSLGSEYYIHLKMGYRTINPHITGPTKNYFLQLLYSALKTERLSMVSEKHRGPLMKKIEICLGLLKGTVNRSILKKLDKDIIASINRWVVEAHKKSAILAVEITKFLIENSCERILLNVDYYDFAQELAGFAWVQYMDDVYSCIIHFEAPQNVFANDPIFYGLADIQETDNLRSDQGQELGTSTSLTGCDCPKVPADCVCWDLLMAQPSPEPEEPFSDI